jgi:hypothetical protein
VASIPRERADPDDTDTSTLTRVPALVDFTLDDVISTKRTYFKRTVTPPTAADTSAPTFGPLSCKITPLAFCN